MLDEEEILLREDRPLRKADVDLEVSAMPYERRLAMAARRAADLFSYVGMISTASLLRELAVAADFEVSATSRFFEDEPE